jgi:transcriptional/translational regulatory protein YebC/TACO1
MRLLFKKGQLGASGSVSWDFDRAGAVEAAPPAAGEDAEEAAIEAGAQEVELAEEGLYRFITEATDLDAVQRALAARGWSVSAANLVWIPKNPVTLEGEARAEVEAFLAALDEDDDVQRLYVGLN